MSNSTEKEQRKKKLTLKQKLVEIRKCVGILQKTEKGNQGASYVDPAVVLFKIRNTMDELGVLLTCEIKTYNVNQILMPTTKNPLNQGYIVDALMVYTWHDESDSTISGDWLATGNHMTDPAMAYGGALTYAERYYLLKFFQIPTTKDDPEFLKQKSGKHEEPTYINEQQESKLLDTLKLKNIGVSQVYQRFGIADLSKLTVYSYNQSMRDLETI